MRRHAAAGALCAAVAAGTALLPPPAHRAAPGPLGPPDGPARLILDARASRGGPRTPPPSTTTTPTTSTTAAEFPARNPPPAAIERETTAPTSPTGRAGRRLRDALRPPTTRAAANLPPPSRPALPAFLVCVRRRESRGDYTVVNPRSGAGGAFQFLPSTWAKVRAHTGWTGLPTRAERATPAQQDHMALALLAWQGRSPWAGPGC